MSEQATERPWRYDRDDATGRYVIYDGRNNLVLRLPAYPPLAQQEGIACLICDAVNEHDELIGVLDSFMEIIKAGGRHALSALREARKARAAVKGEET